MMKVGPNFAFMHTKNTFDTVSISGKFHRKQNSKWDKNAIGRRKENVSM